MGFNLIVVNKKKNTNRDVNNNFVSIYTFKFFAYFQFFIIVFYFVKWEQTGSYLFSWVCSSSSSVACSLSIRKYTVRVASSMVSPEPFSELHQRAAYVSENINRQWRTCSLQLHQLVSLIMWSDTRRLSLRETHLPMILNRGADLLSRGNPLYGEWKLYPQVVNQIWQRSLWGEGEFTTLTQTGSSLGLTHERWNLNAGLHHWSCILYRVQEPLYLLTLYQ